MRGLAAFARALSAMAADHEAARRDETAILPPSPVEAPMPKCTSPRKPRKVPGAGSEPELTPPTVEPGETAPPAIPVHVFGGPEHRIAPPAYPAGRAAACGVCGEAKAPEVLCFVPGCPWSAERDSVWIGPLFGSVDDQCRPAAAAPPPLRAWTLEICGADGKRLEIDVDFDAPGAPIAIRADRPASAYAAPPAAPAPFDPVRAWTEVAKAWTRCACVVSEIPLQLALHLRVRLGL